MIEAAQIDRFAATYAEAVLTFLDAREAQWLLWDGQSTSFDFRSIELDPPRTPVMAHVDASWEQVVGDLDVPADPEHPKFDAEALREAIIFQLCEEGYAERLLKGFQARLARLRESLEAGDEDADEAGESPDAAGTSPED